MLAILGLTPGESHQMGTSQRSRCPPSGLPPFPWACGVLCPLGHHAGASDVGSRVASDADSYLLHLSWELDAYEQLLYINFPFTLSTLIILCLEAIIWEYSVPLGGFCCLSHHFACSYKSHFHGAAPWCCHIAFQEERYCVGSRSLQIRGVM